MKARFYSILFFLLAVSATVPAQEVALDKEGRDAEYVASITQRSQKIVDKLGIADKETALNVRNILINRYFFLNDVYEKRDAAVKTAKETLTGDAKNEAVKAAQDAANAELYKRHFEFDAQLGMYIDEDKIEAVKDGMTYNVVKVTYDSHLDMIPSLKDVEKKQILVWLKEARELAIDAESSKKKHEMFGKYKGRINNYLAKRGYDLKKEREAWYARVKARGGKL